MADWTPYKITTPAAEASAGIALAAQATKLGGLLKGDGQGNVSAAAPGTDYGYSLLTGNGPPSNITAANTGQHYLNLAATAAPFEYICIGGDETGYIWKVYAVGDKGEKGDTGDAAGFGTVTATVDANVGTPSVEVTVSGPDTAKNFDFTFKNMKGEKGDTPTIDTITDAQIDALFE